MWLALFLRSLHMVSKLGFDPETCGLWAHHASAVTTQGKALVTSVLYFKRTSHN